MEKGREYKWYVKAHDSHTDHRIATYSDADTNLIVEGFKVNGEMIPNVWNPDRALITRLENDRKKGEPVAFTEYVKRGNEEPREWKAFPKKAPSAESRRLMRQAHRIQVGQQQRAAL